MREVSGKLNDSLKKNKKTMPFVSIMKGEFEQNGKSVFQNESLIDQWKILQSFVDYIRQTLDLETLDLVSISKAEGLSEQIIDKCGPMKPLITFE